MGSDPGEDWKAPKQQSNDYNPKRDGGGDQGTILLFGLETGLCVFLRSVLPGLGR